VHPAPKSAGISVGSTYTSAARRASHFKLNQIFVLIKTIISMSVPSVFWKWTIDQKLVWTFSIEPVPTLNSGRYLWAVKKPKWQDVTVNKPKWQDVSNRRTFKTSTQLKSLLQISIIYLAQTYTCCFLWKRNRLHPIELLSFCTTTSIPNWFNRLIT